jgi:hypothetical protein
MSYQNIDSKEFWAEIALRAANNYGPFGTGEEIDVNVYKAIDEVLEEIAEDLKESISANEVKHEIRLTNELD